METIVRKILESNSIHKVDSITKVVGLGLVNNVYDVKCREGNYIVRINEDRNKEFEFLKEKWCIEKVMTLNIPSPKVFKVGMMGEFPFMIQNKIEGVNGSACTPEQKLMIWKSLGQYASLFHRVNKIEELHVATDEFHSSWESKLEYNINQLSENDSLLNKNVFSKEEQSNARTILLTLKHKVFSQGLIHGDLCPRNVIYKDQNVFLLDWGSSKIDIVPHTEIGIVQMDNNLNEGEFEAFLEGMGIDISAYQRIEEEIKHINFLNRLDLYRWADGNEIEEIDEYIAKLRMTFNTMMNL